jgi:hypothetical protein
MYDDMADTGIGGAADDSDLDVDGSGLIFEI